MRVCQAVKAFDASIPPPDAISSSEAVFLIEILNLHFVPGFVALPECFTGKYGVSHFASYRYAQLRMLPTSIISPDQLFILLCGDQGENSLASV